MTQVTNQKRSLVLKTVFLAAISVGLYTALFANEASVTEYYTRGGIYAAFPVLTAFVFSFAHGAFASNLLETLGLTAHVSPTVESTVSKQKQPKIRKDQRPRVHAN